MLRLRPFRKNDAKTIITWTSEEKEFYKWSAGILGEYPVSENRMLEATSAREANDRYFPFTKMRYTFHLEVLLSVTTSVIRIQYDTKDLTVT